MIEYFERIRGHFRNIYFGKTDDLFISDDYLWKLFSLLYEWIRSSDCCIKILLIYINLDVVYDYENSQKDDLTDYWSPISFTNITILRKYLPELKIIKTKLDNIIKGNQEDFKKSAWPES